MPLTKDQLRAEHKAFQEHRFKKTGKRPLLWDAISADPNVDIVTCDLFGTYLNSIDEIAWQAWLACLEWHRVQ
jgi:hypothetical protein